MAALAAAPTAALPWRSRVGRRDPRKAASARRCRCQDFNSPEVGRIRLPLQERHRIMLNLDQARSPWWGLSKVDGPLSLSPSVNYYNGRRRCHYFVRNGKIDWVGDSFGDR
ncbi:DUF6527 family protein [Bradyrhizobium sp. JR4.1]|uniref:DUF6527 family protein n=1 Tax=Bradyrhizobium sp. JR4.1 TaxID=3156372 RepID=UPI00339A87B8